MDLTVDIENYKLNIRVAALIIHNNKFLTHKSIRSDHFCLPGGRIQVGESSAEAIKREIKEEIGMDICIKDDVALIENFFEKDGIKYHEFYLIYEAEFTDKEAKKIEHSLDNKEGKDYLKYEWIDINDIESTNIVPLCLKDIITEKLKHTHIIYSA